MDFQLCGVRVCTPNPLLVQVPVVVDGTVSPCACVCICVRVCLSTLSMCVGSSVCVSEAGPLFLDFLAAIPAGPFLVSLRLPSQGISPGLVERLHAEFGVPPRWLPLLNSQQLVKCGPEPHALDPGWRGFCLPSGCTCRPTGLCLQNIFAGSDLLQCRLASGVSLLSSDLCWPSSVSGLYSLPATFTPVEAAPSLLEGEPLSLLRFPSNDHFLCNGGAQHPSHMCNGRSDLL